MLTHLSQRHHTVCKIKNNKCTINGIDRRKNLGKFVEMHNLATVWQVLSATLAYLDVELSRVMSCTVFFKVCKFTVHNFDCPQEDTVVQQGTAGRKQGSLV